MNDERFKQLLSAYKFPDAEAEQIDLTCQKTMNALKRKVPTRPFSILTQMKVQATYLSKWFYISCGLIAFFSLLISAITNTERIAAVFFGTSPLFILPCAAVFYRTIANGMLELETASKYSMAKLFAGKLLILGAVISVLLLSAGIIGGTLSGSIIRPPLLAFVSFTWMAAIVLWFGKRSIKRGLAFGTLWSAVSIALAFWGKCQMFLEAVDILFVWMAFLVVTGFVLFAAIRFIRNISFEGVCEEWNFLLTA
ncbi:MAG: hypothetical protein LBT32_00235 [Peptococcaceae bacterium]|jgi:hypothetical protein|nr:hypothetical protein [Peptococcaceae bacterium]